jgi:hypothetical protein
MSQYHRTEAYTISGTHNPYTTRSLRAHLINETYGLYKIQFKIIHTNCLTLDNNNNIVFLYFSR